MNNAARHWLWRVYRATVNPYEAAQLVYQIMDSEPVRKREMLEHFRVFRSD